MFRVCHVILKYNDNIVNMIEHAQRKHGHLTAPTATPSASNTIAIISRLLYYYRDSIAIVKSPAIVTPTN